jgi:hypothetical protein
MFYNITYKTMQFCDGTNWINMGVPSTPERLVSGSVSVITYPSGISLTGHVSASGNLSAVNLYGNGSNLTGVSGIPSGLIAAFASTTCPSGWSEYTAARGRFLRGIDNGAGVDPSGTRTPGATQDDELKSHTHLTYAAGWLEDTGTTGTSRWVGHGAETNTTATGGAETRPKNVAVLFCRKN